MLKKQTVWLLTMLSLMIVLSIYYMTSDQEDIAYIEIEDSQLEETIQEEESDEGVEIEDVREVEQNEFFTTIQMELEDKRNVKKDRLKDIVASTDATTKEINSALDEMDELDSIAAKESILQETILTTNEGFEDVLVRAESDKAHVHVLAEQLSKNDALEIMQMVKDELGEIVVDVNFQEVNE